MHHRYEHLPQQHHHRVCVRVTDSQQVPERFDQQTRVCELQRRVYDQHGTNQVLGFVIIAMTMGPHTRAHTPTSDTRTHTSHTRTHARTHARTRDTHTHTHTHTTDTHTHFAHTHTHTHTLRRERVPAKQRRLPQGAHMHQHGGIHVMWRLPSWVCQRWGEGLQRCVCVCVRVCVCVCVCVCLSLCVSLSLSLFSPPLSVRVCVRVCGLVFAIWCMGPVCLRNDLYAFQFQQHYHNSFVMTWEENCCCCETLTQPTLSHV